MTKTDGEVGKGETRLIYEREETAREWGEGSGERLYMLLPRITVHESHIEAVSADKHVTVHL